jgi:adenylyltransferase/sulfurtransferase
MDGQLAVLNSPPSKGPCYRCIWPLPPPAESVTSCGDGGILGPVVGVMGVLQALEAIKLLTLKVDEDVGSLRESRLLILSAYADTQWRTLRMRGKREKCISCGTPDNLQQKISRETILNGGIDYVAFCGVATAVPKSLLLDDDFRLDVAEVRKRRRSRAEMILVDVRDETQFGICSVEGSVNVPFDQFHIQRANMSNSKSEGSNDHHQPKLPRVLLDLLETVERRERNEKGSSSPPIVILCRQGNDSQIVVRTIMESGVFKGPLFDLKGGISAWAREAPEDGLVEY